MWGVCWEGGWGVRGWRDVVLMGCGEGVGFGRGVVDVWDENRQWPCRWQALQKRFGMFGMCVVYW